MGLLSLCRKAGKLRIGFEPVKESVAAGEAKLILFASDFSPRSRQRMEGFLENEESPPPCRTLTLSMYDLSQICTKLTGVCAVADKGFADGIEKQLSGPDKGGAE